MIPGEFKPIPEIPGKILEFETEVEVKVNAEVAALLLEYVESQLRAQSEMVNRVVDLLKNLYKSEVILKNSEKLGG